MNVKQLNEVLLSPLWIAKSKYIILHDPLRYDSRSCPITNENFTEKVPRDRGQLDIQYLGDEAKIPLGTKMDVKEFSSHWNESYGRPSDKPLNPLVSFRD